MHGIEPPDPPFFLFHPKSVYYMAHSLFISDLHLCVEQTQSTNEFLQFIQQTAPRAETLYILGDLFEYWAGDDDINNPLHCQIADALHGLSSDGTTYRSCETAICIGQICPGLWCQTIERPCAD